MILEELVGSFVSLVSAFIIGMSPVSRENLQGNCTSIFREVCEKQEVDNGLIHREYEQETQLTSTGRVSSTFGKYSYLGARR